MRRLFLTLSAFVSIATFVTAADWNQWRGPDRSGLVPAVNVPNAWPAAVKPVWRTDVGEGYASPVLAGGRIFVHSRRDPDEIVTAIDVATGTIAWRQKYAAPFTKNQYAISRAKGPHATPLASADRLFTMGATGILSAWSTKDGALVWRKDYSSSVDTSKLFCGTAASPLIENGSLVVQVGSDVHGGRVMALDPATGAERWTWKGPGPGYASPLVFTAGGVTQIAVLTESSIAGINAKTGAALWSVPFPDDWHENIVTPVWTGTHLVVSGPRQGTHAFAVRQNGATWAAAEAWKNAEATMYMSTPVVADGVLYGFSNKRKGQFVALDAATGAVRWATDGREGDHASVLLTPSAVVYLTAGADLVIVRRTGEKFEETKRYNVANSETWAVPILMSDGLIVRDATAIVRLTM